MFVDLRKRRRAFSILRAAQQRRVLREEYAEERGERGLPQPAPRSSGGTDKPRHTHGYGDGPAWLRGVARTVRPAPARSGCGRRAPCGAAHPPASAGCCRRARASPRAGSPASRGRRPRPGQAQEEACEACSWKGSERREIVNNERGEQLSSSSFSFERRSLPVVSEGGARRLPHGPI